MHGITGDDDKLRKLTSNHRERRNNLALVDQALHINMKKWVRHLHHRRVDIRGVAEEMGHGKQASHKKIRPQRDHASLANRLLLRKNVRRGAKANLREHRRIQTRENPVLLHCWHGGGNSHLRAESHRKLVQVSLFLAAHASRLEQCVQVVYTPVLQPTANVVRVHVALQRGNPLAELGPLLPQLAEHSSHLSDAYRKNAARNKHERDRVATLGDVDRENLRGHSTHDPERPIQAEQIPVTLGTVHPSEIGLVLPELTAPLRGPVPLAVVFVRIPEKPTGLPHNPPDTRIPMAHKQHCREPPQQLHPVDEHRRPRRADLLLDVVQHAVQLQQLHQAHEAQKPSELGNLGQFRHARRARCGATTFGGHHQAHDDAPGDR
mmetsp:Transcript_10563/g.26869  ORF Transcript_10563/g.26869 Transcript_10563/m.26869 type:complete len:378 (-) Transcript_10563:557-1690(-)